MIMYGTAFDDADNYFGCTSMRSFFIYENKVYHIIYSEYTGNHTAHLFNTV